MTSQVPVVALPNSPAALAARIGRLPAVPLLVAVLLLRPALALLMQLVFVAGAAVAGSADPWRSGADWWLGSFALGEIANLVILVVLLRREGVSFWSLFRTRRAFVPRDLLWLLLALVVTGPLALVPNLALGTLLWGNAQVGADLSFRPLPIEWVLVILLFFPVIHALTELPTYFGYVMPRLQARTGAGVWPWLLCSVVLSLQHVFLPLLFDWRFVVWRALMFLPFALWMGFVLWKRPTLLPYLAVGHWLLDLQLPLIVFLVSFSFAP